MAHKSLTNEEIIGIAEPGSQAATESLNRHSQAKEFLQKQDTVELFRLYEEQVRANAEFGSSMASVLNHYIGDSKTPRYQPPNDAIQSMEKVALAAIQLARDVAVKAKREE